MGIPITYKDCHVVWHPYAATTPHAAAATHATSHDKQH